MARSPDLKQLKTQFERLRRDSLETVSAASRIISQSVHNLAEKDLKMLESSYKSLIKLADSKRKEGKDVAGQQLDAMQKMIERMLDSARESLALSAQAREELARLLLKGEQRLDALTHGKAAKIVEPARKALLESQSIAKGKVPAKGKPGRKPASEKKAAPEKAAAPAKRRGRPPKSATATGAVAASPTAKAPAKRGRRPKSAATQPSESAGAPKRGDRKPASEKTTPAQNGSGDAGS